MNAEIIDAAASHTDTSATCFPGHILLVKIVFLSKGIEFLKMLYAYERTDRRPNPYCDMRWGSPRR